MSTQTVFKAGNSNVVTIPKHLLEELSIKSGEKVSVQKSQSEDGILIKKANKSDQKNISPEKNFKIWWREFLKENSEVLDELAIR